ncbi:hypothetical protein [Streptomyces roseoverticillatus]|uniref:Uncharacterized protein n=1 Tax=Streptomyces roseoverticillatus TaxID=66429 RepID=A0ABV3IWJ2_9ACTN
MQTPAEPPVALEEPACEVVGLRQAQQKHLPDVTLTTLRWVRANDLDLPASAGKKVTELLYQSRTSSGGPITGPARGRAAKTRLRRPAILLGSLQEDGQE